MWVADGLHGAAAGGGHGRRGGWREVWKWGWHQSPVWLAWIYCPFQWSSVQNLMPPGPPSCGDCWHPSLVLFLVCICRTQKSSLGGGLSVPCPAEWGPSQHKPAKATCPLGGVWCPGAPAWLCLVVKWLALLESSPSLFASGPKHPWVSPLSRWPGGEPRDCPHPLLT